MNKINIANDYSRYPSGRFKKNGNSSGQGFREALLIPAIKEGEVEIELDGTIGYGSSFLEEAFGGLVRELKISGDKLLKQIKLTSEDDSLIKEIEDYMLQAKSK